MHQGNWTCSVCNGAITQLPFEPRSNAGLKCIDCFKKGAGNGGNGNSTPTQEYEGNWTCSKCGGSITKLKFQPRDTSTLKCLDCFKQEKRAEESTNSVPNDSLPF